MRSCAIHVHKHSVEAMLLQQCREVTTVILSIMLWLPTYMGRSLIRCNSPSGLRNLLSICLAHLFARSTCAILGPQWTIN